MEEPSTAEEGLWRIEGDRCRAAASVPPSTRSPRRVLHSFPAWRIVMCKGNVFGTVG